MNTVNLVRSELLKLTTTRMPLVFAGVLGALAIINGIAVAAGTDMDGSKGFIATAADQQSIMAFASNALLLSAFFGATAAARVYANSTVIATFLETPNRARAIRAQLIAVAIGGAVLGVVGAALTITAVAVTLPTTDFGFFVSATGVAEVVAASAWAGAAGAVLGAAIGTVVRNTGGAVTGTVLALVIAPPLVVQLTDSAARWVPSTLANVASGVATDTGRLSSVIAIGVWAIVPAAVAIWSVTRRDVV